MKAREQRAEYLVSKSTDYLTTNDIIAAISRGLHHKNAESDQSLVNRKQKFFESLLPDESSVKAFILLVT